MCLKWLNGFKILLLRLIVAGHGRGWFAVANVGIYKLTDEVLSTMRFLVDKFWKCPSNNALPNDPNSNEIAWEELFFDVNSSVILLDLRR